MAKASGTIDLKSMKKAHDDASKTATDYLHFDSQTGLDVGDSSSLAKVNIKSNTGVSIYDEDGNVRNVVDSDGMAIKDASGNDVAKFGSTAQIGQDASGHVVTTSSGMEVYKDATTRVAQFGQGVALGEPDHLTFKIVNSTTMRISEVVHPSNLITPKSGTASYEKITRFDVSSIYRIRVKVFIWKSTLPAEYPNEETITLTPSAMSATTAYGGQTVSYSLSNNKITVNVVNSNTTYRALIVSITHIYNTTTTGLSRIVYGANPIDSTENALSVGNGTPTSKSNALAVDWSGNFTSQMAVATLVASNQPFGEFNSDIDVECASGLALGSCFELNTDDVWIGNDGTSGINYKINILQSGYYYIAASHIWSAVQDMNRVRRIGAGKTTSIQLTPQYVGNVPLCRGDTWETCSSTGVAYLQKGDIIGMLGKVEALQGSTNYCTLYNAQLIIRPAWFM